MRVSFWSPSLTPLVSEVDPSSERAAAAPQTTKIQRYMLHRTLPSGVDVFTSAAVLSDKDLDALSKSAPSRGPCMQNLLKANARMTHTGQSKTRTSLPSILLLLLRPPPRPGPASTRPSPPLIRTKSQRQQRSIRSPSLDSETSTRDRQPRPGGLTTSRHRWRGSERRPGCMAPRRH